MSPAAPHDLVIRLAGPSDRPAVARLAALDSARAPEGRVLLAELRGEAVAAVALEGGAAVADPFRPSAGAAELLALRAAELGAPAGSGRAAGRRCRPLWRRLLAGVRRRVAPVRGSA